MVPCMGTVTCPEPLPATADAAARLGRPAARPGAAAVPRSGTHSRTEKRRPSTSAVTSRCDGRHLVLGRRRAGAGAPAVSATRPLRSSVSSTHLVECVAAAKSGWLRIATSAGSVVATPVMRVSPMARSMRRRAASRSGAHTISLAMRLS